LSGSGDVTVYTGTASLGQGMETTLAQVCSTHLGLPFERVTVRHGDTAVIPEGMGSFGSRAAMMGGAAVMGASVQLRRQVLESAAEELEAAPHDLVLTVDGVAVRGAPSPINPLGVKGAGEGGTAAVGGAIANAVADALGVEVTQLPLSPQRVIELASA